MSVSLIQENVTRGESKESIIDTDGVLRIGGRICVPKVGKYFRLIHEEAHYSKYSIHQVRQIYIMTWASTMDGVVW